MYIIYMLQNICYKVPTNKTVNKKNLKNSNTFTH